MRSGPLRHRITVQKPVETQDAFGEVDVTWATHVESWASVDPISSRESFQASRDHAEMTHRVRMRYRPGITHKMRILFGERVLNIRSIINHREINRHLELLCEEFV